MTMRIKNHGDAVCCSVGGHGRIGRSAARHGMVIIVVAVVIVLVSLAGYGFLKLMEAENLAAHARGDRLQAESVAASGRELLAAVLEAARADRPPGAETDDLPDLFGPVVVDGPEEEQTANDESVRAGRFFVLAEQDSELAESAVRRGYENESAKLNLVQLVLWDRRHAGTGRMALMSLPGMDESTADALLDWVDRDNVAREMGAEADYYKELEPPRQPTNGPPESLDELLLVRGVTRERLFGVDVNQNFQIDPWESRLAEDQAVGSGGSDARPWSHYLTVFSGERDESFDGQPRISLNEPDLGQLHAKLAKVLEPSWANFIIAYRQYGRMRGGGPTQQVDDLAPDLAVPAKVRIRSPLELIGARVALKSDSKGATKAKNAKRPRNAKKPKKRRVLRSPFTTDPNQMRQYLPKLMDRVTVGTGQPIFGRVNINLAPREVLVGVPGIDGAIAERILAARTLNSGDNNRSDPTWLLIEQIVDLRQMRRLLPYITTGGDVGRAQIIGFYDMRSPIMRMETVIDATDRPARQVYYKDLRRLGRGPLAGLLQAADATAGMTGSTTLGGG